MRSVMKRRRLSISYQSLRAALSADPPADRHRERGCADGAGLRFVQVFRDESNTRPYSSTARITQSDAVTVSTRTAAATLRLAASASGVRHMVSLIRCPLFRSTSSSALLKPSASANHGTAVSP